jgi:hypothetical protein
VHLWNDESADEALLGEWLDPLVALCGPIRFVFRRKVPPRPPWWHFADEPGPKFTHRFC